MPTSSVSSENEVGCFVSHFSRRCRLSLLCWWRPLRMGWELVLFLIHRLVFLYLFINQLTSSPFIGPASDLWLCLSLTDSLTNSMTQSRLVDLIDVTLVCEDAYSKLVEVATVADVSDEDCRVGNSLLPIWKLRFGLKA